MPNCLLISGGSRGLGLDVVRRYLDLGWNVATFSRTSNSAIKELQSRWKEKFLFESLSAKDFSRVEEFIQKVVERYTTIDALINNAAVGQDNLLSQTTIEEIESLIESNMTAPIVLTRSVIRHNLKCGRPCRIINVSSICGSRGYPGLSVYSATKGALDAFTRSLSRELGPRGFLVNAVAPGIFRTEMSASLHQAQIDSITNRTATGRLTEIRDILPLIDFLLTNNTQMTGQILYVDGGIGN